MINPLKIEDLLVGNCNDSAARPVYGTPYKAHAIDPTVITTGLGSIGGGVGLIFARDGNHNECRFGTSGCLTNSKGEAIVTPVGPAASPSLVEKLPEIIADTKAAHESPPA